MSFQFEVAQITAYIFVFVRMLGMCAFNPILSRKNIPARVRVALTLGLTILITPGVNVEQVAGLPILGLVGALFIELLVGFCCSFCFYLFYYMLFFAGDLLDVEFGLSMARVFDPGTSIQMSMTSTLLNLIFVLYFFTTDSHLLLIRLFASSYQIVPLGGEVITTALPGFFIDLFSTSFNLVMRLALPFVSALFVSEVAMGVLMKLVPQIHVFVISIQFKILIGLLLMFLFSVPICNFIDNYLSILFTSMENALYALT